METTTGRRRTGGEAATPSAKPALGASALFFLLFVLGACSGGEEDGEIALDRMVIGEESLTEDALVIAPQDYDADTLLVSTINGIGAAAEEIEGEIAVLTDGPSEPLRLALTATGLEPGDHAWHIHSGPCGSSAGVAIPLSQTAEMEAVVGPLAVDQTGQAEVTVEVPPLKREMLGTRERSLHIHEKSGIEHGPSVACATI